MTEQLLTVRDVANMLNVSPGWVRDHCGRKQPELPHVRLVSMLRFRHADIEEWIEKMRKCVA